MKLKINENLRKDQERSIKTFEHFLGHFFSKYITEDEWEMEVWLIDNQNIEQTLDEVKGKQRYNCGIMLSRPEIDTICTTRLSSNLSGAIFYALKAVHRELCKQSALKTKNSFEDITQDTGGLL